MKFRVVTLNLLFDDWLRWERLDLAVQQIKQLNPDVIMLQEVSLKSDVPAKLRQLLPGYHMQISPRGGQMSQIAQATLTKQKPLSTQTLNLSQDRIAQKVCLKTSDTQIDFINSHLYFSPLRDKPRQAQVKQLLEFAMAPSVVAGDFNAHPQSGSIRLLERRFNSTHKLAKGQEPRRTTPTPLWRGKGLRHSLRRQGLAVANKTQRGTIDYIFVDKQIKVISCDLAFTKPANNNPALYASDHFGLVAELEI